MGGDEHVIRANWMAAQFEIGSNLAVFLSGARGKIQQDYVLQQNFHSISVPLRFWRQRYSKFHLGVDDGRDAHIANMCLREPSKDFLICTFSCVRKDVRVQ